MFRITPQVSCTHTEFFGQYRGSLTPKFQALHLRGLTAPFFLHPTHINYFSFYDLNYESLLDVVLKTNSTHIDQEWWTTFSCIHTRLEGDVTVQMNAIMSIHISNSNGSYTIIFHIIQNNHVNTSISINMSFSIHISSHSIQAITVLSTTHLSCSSCQATTYKQFHMDNFGPKSNPDRF